MTLINWIKIALETAIINTAEQCCKDCDGNGEFDKDFTCQVLKLYKNKKYDEIISEIEDIECGDWFFDILPVKKIKWEI